MRIVIEKSDSVGETEIIVRCRNVDQKLAEVIANLSLADESTIAGEDGGETFFIHLNEIYYFESVEGRMFFYTKDKSYECATRLYLLEERLENTMFTRISKTTIANLRKFRSIQAGDNSRLVASLMNGEKVIVSRQYVKDIKNKLGVK